MAEDSKQNGEELTPLEYEQLDHFVTLMDETDDSMPHETMAMIIDELRFTRMTKLHIKGSQLAVRLTDTNVVRMTAAMLAANIQLEELSLPYHRIGDMGFEEICRLLQPGSYAAETKESVEIVRHLLYLNLEGNDITGDTINKTCLLSKYDCPLQYLNLSSNPLSKTGQENIAMVLQQNQTLQHIFVNSCSFELSELVQVCSHIYENQSLITFAMDRPILTKAREGEIADHVSRIILRHPSLQSISMKYHALTDREARVMTESLNATQQLISLNLECNNIGVSGAEALASNLLINHHRCIQYLGLAYNLVGDDGAIALAEAIKSNTNLRVLSLKNNRIGPKGLMAIAHALETCSNLESITLFGNHFDNDTGKKYQELIQNRLAYTNMYIDIHVYEVDGVYHIAEN